MRDHVETEACSREEFEHVIQNMRGWDRQEMTAMGFNDETVRDLFDQLPWIVGRLNGDPVCVFSHQVTEYLLHFVFFGTSVIDRRLLRFTRHARGYIDSICNLHWGLRPVVAVWEGHTESRQWLELLGFEDHGIELWFGENRFLMVERLNK